MFIHIVKESWGKYNKESVKKAIQIIYNYVVNSQNRKFTISNDDIISRSFDEDDHIPTALLDAAVCVAGEFEGFQGQNREEIVLHQHVPRKQPGTFQLLARHFDPAKI